MLSVFSVHKVPTFLFSKQSQSIRRAARTQNTSLSFIATEPLFPLLSSFCPRNGQRRCVIVRKAIGRDWRRSALSRTRRVIGATCFPSLFLDAVLILPSKKPSLHFKPHRLAAPNALGPHALRSWRRCRWLPAAAERVAAAAAAGSNRSSSSSGPVAIEGSVEEVECCCCCCRLDRRCCSYFSRPFGPLGQDTQRCCCV